MFPPILKKRKLCAIIFIFSNVLDDGDDFSIVYKYFIGTLLVIVKLIVAFIYITMQGRRILCYMKKKKGKP